VADISRQKDGTPNVHLLSLVKLYATEEEASTAALDAAKAWIDRHHRELQGEVN
jgi:hypothetical protein